MVQNINLTIDGAQIRVAKGASVLDAAVENGICIPHLCHVPSLRGFGACRLCIVEHIVDGRAKVTTSCTLKAQEGMVIKSSTDRIRKLRRNIAELIVAQAPNSRAVQDIALRCGVKEVRYSFRDGNCILCGRCVRSCNDLWNAKALGFVGRGKNRKVSYPFGKRPDFCKQCNYCVQLCPMTITPCEGPMKPGQGKLCGRCESTLTVSETMPGVCIWCKMGEGFSCGRHAGA